MASRKAKNNNSKAGGSEENEKEMAALMYSTDPKIIEIQKKLNQAFALYDQGNQKMIDLRSAGILIHAMGLMPSAGELQNMISDLQDPSVKGLIKYERIVPYLTKVMTDGKLYRPVEDDLIRECFEAFDKEKTGTIEPLRLNDALMREGEIFTADEVEKMMTCGVETSDNLFHYEEYIEKASRHIPKKEDKGQDSDDEFENPEKPA